MTHYTQNRQATFHALLANKDATNQFARQLATWVPTACVIYLQGELGAGKTTFTQAFLRQLGVTEPIKSPTYSLIERYALARSQAWHLDLYRIGDPEELLWLGLDALDQDQQMVLIEWPDRGQALLPPSDLIVSLSYVGEGREVNLSAQTGKGEVVVHKLLHNHFIDEGER